MQPTTGEAYCRREDLCLADICTSPGEDGWRSALLVQVQARCEKMACHEYLQDALWRWLLRVARSQHTVATYLLGICEWIGRRDKRGLDQQWATRPREVEEYLLDLRSAGYSQRTVATRLAVLRSWFTWAEEREHIERSPIRRHHRVKIDRKAVRKADGMRQALTPDQAQEVGRWCLQIAEPVAGAAVALMLDAGLRSAEVAGAERRGLSHDEEGDHWLVIKGKGDKTRRALLGPLAVACLLRYAREHRRRGTRGALLRSPGGGHYTARQVQLWAKDAAGFVGREREISSHDFRKTCASLLRMRGAPTEDVQEQLGHANPQTTLDCYVVFGRDKKHRTGIEVPA